MKLKKVLTVLFTCVMVLTMSSSAYASETSADLTEVTPYIIGVGDTQDKALTLVPGQNYTLFLDNDKNDNDWYKWTNNTGEHKYFSMNVMFDGRNSDFRLGFTIDYGNGRKTNIVYTDFVGTGNTLSLESIYLPPGATIYAVVGHKPGRPENTYFTTQYTLWWYNQV